LRNRIDVGGARLAVQQSRRGCGAAGGPNAGGARTAGEAAASTRGRG